MIGAWKINNKIGKHNIRTPSCFFKEIRVGEELPKIKRVEYMIIFKCNLDRCQSRKEKSGRLWWNVVPFAICGDNLTCKVTHEKNWKNIHDGMF